MIRPRPLTSLLPPPRSLSILIPRRSRHIPPSPAHITPTPSASPPTPSTRPTTISLFTLFSCSPRRAHHLPLSSRASLLPIPSLQPSPHPRVPLIHHPPPLNSLIRHARLPLQPPPPISPPRRALPPKHRLITQISPVERLLTVFRDRHVLRVARVKHRAAHVRGVVRVVALVVVRVKGRQGREDGRLGRAGGAVGQEGVGRGRGVALADVQAGGAEGEGGEVFVVVGRVADG